MITTDGYNYERKLTRHLNKYQSEFEIFGIFQPQKTSSKASYSKKETYILKWKQS